MKNHGNKFFIKRPLFKPTFVEDYLARNSRTLYEFMTRLFILAPNLKYLNGLNPRLHTLAKEFDESHKDKYFHPKWARYGPDYKIRVKCHPKRVNGLYVNYYRTKWHEFLKENIDESGKKFHSPFKKGECYDFKLKTIRDDSK